MSTLVAGSVTVSSLEVATGTGMALAIYAADAATMTLPTAPTLGATSAPYTAERPVAQTDVDSVKAGRVSILQDAARRATAYASAIVSDLQAHGIGT